MPCGFAKCVIEVRDPEIDNLSDHAVRELENKLQTNIKIVWAKIYKDSNYSMSKLTKTLLVVAAFFVGYAVLWTVSLYSCPHFLVFPSTQILTENYIVSGKLKSLDPSFANAELRNIAITTSCGQGSDDEAELAHIQFEFSTDNVNWSSKKAVVETDFGGLFSERIINDVFLLD